MLSWSKASLAAYFESGVNSHATASRPSEPGQGRLYAVSDVHTDKLENMAWWRRLEERSAHRADSLILAGDVSHRPDVLLETLQIAARAFRTVHFVPGNHDLWVRGGGGGGG
uniref:Calcineurin-like phosphoesterase domain-containing protein n=1 Tax=Emiliania huxleyi TaxID=2903 RepID=A0A7S3TVQ4_EMIHU